MSAKEESSPARTSLLGRFFFCVDPKSIAILLVGVLQVPACMLLLYATVAQFPPDIRVFWNLPVPKGGSPGIGPYSITIILTIVLIWHTVAMIRKRTWAILVAAIPYLALGVLRLKKGVSELHQLESPVDIRVLSDHVVDFCMGIVSIYIFVVALKIMVDYFTTRNKSCEGETTVRAALPK